MNKYILRVKISNLYVLKSYLLVKEPLADYLMIFCYNSQVEPIPNSKFML